MASGVLGIGFTIWKTAWVKKQSEGTERMSQIGTYVMSPHLEYQWSPTLIFPIKTEAGVHKTGVVNA